MIRHLTSEQLSAYLDGEVASPEAREIEVHLASCDGCRDRFKSIQRTVSGIWRLERAAPPPDLGARVSAGVAAVRKPPAPAVPVRSFVTYIFGLPQRPVLRTAAAMALALVLSLFLVTNGERSGLEESLITPLPPSVEIVTVEALAVPPHYLPPTLSKVAGREFVWRELHSGDVWVQKGLEGEEPEARVSAQSPQGRELLTQYSELGLLLADGSRVVLRYGWETVELSQGV